jgi:hypothetical protein
MPHSLKDIAADQHCEKACYDVVTARESRMSAD